MASLSLEHVLFLAITVLIVAVVGYFLQGTVKTNAEKAGAQANSHFGKTPEFSVVPSGVIERYAEQKNITVNNNTSSAYVVSLKLTLTNIKNTDNETYLQIAVTNPGMYAWKIYSVDAGKIVTSGNTNTVKNITVYDYSTAFKIGEIYNNGNYTANSDIPLHIVFATNKSVVADDEFVFKIQIGDSAPHSITVDVHPPIA